MNAINTLIEQYGSMNKAAAALGISRQHFQQWKEQGFIPFKRATEVEKLTAGKIKAVDIWEAASRAKAPK